MGGFDMNSSVLTNLKSPNNALKNIKNLSSYKPNRHESKNSDVNLEVTEVKVGQYSNS